jgi:hypothetical protein
MTRVERARLRAIGSPWAQVARLAGRLLARQHAAVEAEAKADAADRTYAANYEFGRAFGYEASARQTRYLAQDLRWAAMVRR